MREDLAARWAELKTPLADRVECLSVLLDAAPAGPELVSRYEAIAEKLAARQPIAQVSHDVLLSMFQHCSYRYSIIDLAGQSQAVHRVQAEISNPHGTGRQQLHCGD